jgi:hypothetical protein
MLRNFFVQSVLYTIFFVIIATLFRFVSEAGFLAQWVAILLSLSIPAFIFGFVHAHVFGTSIFFVNTLKILSFPILISVIMLIYYINTLELISFNIIGLMSALFAWVVFILLTHISFVIGSKVSRQSTNANL